MVGDDEHAPFQQPTGLVTVVPSLWYTLGLGIFLFITQLTLSSLTLFNVTHPTEPLHTVDLRSLPAHYDALKTPINTILIQFQDYEQTLFLIGIRRYSSTYMELYAEESVVVSICMSDGECGEPGVFLSVPESSIGELRTLDSDAIASHSASPMVSSLLQFAHNGEIEVPEVALDPEHRRLFRLRIGRVTFCLFCRKMGCKGNQYSITCLKIVGITIAIR